MFTIYSADVIGNPGNCSYPHKHVILDEASLKAAICHDYVCAEYRNSYRNGDNFIASDNDSAKRTSTAFNACERCVTRLFEKTQIFFGDFNLCLHILYYSVF